MWVTAAIGLACGTGLYLIATITTLLALLGLELLILLFPHTSSTILALSFKTDSKEQLKSALAQIKSHVVEIITYEVKELDSAAAASTLCFRVTLSVKCRKGKDLSEIISILENFSEVAISNKEEL